MKNFSIQIASVPDRENLVAEIWHGDDLLSELSNENKELEIEFYGPVVNRFNFEELSKILIKAKNKLLGETSSWQDSRDLYIETKEEVIIGIWLLFHSVNFWVRSVLRIKAERKSLIEKEFTDYAGAYIYENRLLN